MRFIASTSGVARDGWVIDQNSWLLDNYRTNPVLLWGHNYSSLPIGRCDVLPAGDRLECIATFDQGDEFARKIEDKYRRGFLNAVSVGWASYEQVPPSGPGKPTVLRQNELLDISCVSVPGDPGALVERQARALAKLSEEFSSTLDTLLNASDPSEGARGSSVTDEASWNDAAILMMRLFVPGLPMSERDRRRAYNRIAAQYRRAGKTAPEWLPAESLASFDLGQVRGLFLENEPDLFPALFTEARAGAMLSARNRSDLEKAMDCKRQAISLVQGVLDRATKPDPNADPDAADEPDPNDPGEDSENEKPPKKKASSEIEGTRSEAPRSEAPRSEAAHSEATHVDTDPNRNGLEQLRQIRDMLDQFKL